MNNYLHDVEALPNSSPLDDDENSPRGRSRRIEAPRRSTRRPDGGASGNVNVKMGIPLGELHRRQSRDNGSAPGDNPVYHPREQQAPLLDPENDSPRERRVRYEAPWELKRPECNILVGWALLFIIFAFLTWQVTSMSYPQRSPSNLYSDSSDGPLGILLHPDDHVSRRPKRLTHYWNITSEYRAPDGVLKKVYLINGQFPGPLVECRTGDRLTIHVTNKLDSPEDRVSIHWHGVNMRGANAMDGASAFTQCSIPPNNSFTYDFEIDSESSGTFWYHAHSDVQRGDGMYGGLVVHDAMNRGQDLVGYNYEKEVLLLVGDWYHRSASEVLDWYMSVRAFKNEPVPDSLLINGVGKFTCSRAVPARPVRCIEKWTDKTPGLFDDDMRDIPIRLRIVNVGSLAGFTLGTSSGAFLPLTVDGGYPIEGSVSDSVGILHPGERVDLLLLWDKDSAPNDRRLRVSLDQENFKYPNPALKSHQSFPFFTSKSIDTDALMRGWEMGSETPEGPFALDLAIPTHVQHQVPPIVDQTILLYVKTEQRSQFGNRPMGFINRTSWAPQAMPPLALNAIRRESWDSNQLIPFIPLPESKPLWVDIIVNNLDDGSHPFHLHGYNFYVLASHRSENGGWGSYSPYATAGDASIPPLINPGIFLRKDTVSVPRRGYVILRFLADNPGIWMFHCHVLFHMASGMTMGFHVGGDEGHTMINAEAREYCDSL